MCRNAIDFCVFCIVQLYWIYSHSLRVESLGFTTYRTMSSANGESFTSFWFDIIDFFVLTAVARTSSTALNKSSESGRTCSWLERDTFCFWVWWQLWVCHICPYVMLRSSASVSSLLRLFIIRGRWVLPNSFYWEDMIFSFWLEIFHFQTLNTWCHFLLGCKVSAEISANGLKGVLLFKKCFSLAATRFSPCL